MLLLLCAVLRMHTLLLLLLLLLLLWVLHLLCIALGARQKVVAVMLRGVA